MGFDIHGFHYRVTTSGRVQCIVGNCGSTYQDGIFCSLLRHDETRTVGRQFHLTHFMNSWVAQQYCIRSRLIIHVRILDTHYEGSGDNKVPQHGISP
jgi:hypothetical protein